ncbi:MAG: Holliday junction resolvase RuvX [Syntrophomonadaceae bacterium]|nr:Holliday junction resolvase RuvX [Syntrophomonadaceae bacterium]
MRIMCLDVGQKRIGIALSDSMGWTAQGHSVLQRTSGDDMARISALCSENEVETIVVGFPLNMNGTEGPKAMEIKEYARELAEYTGLRVELWDERLTTVTAEKILIQADVSRRKRKQVIDKMAATVILQSYLDSHTGK